MYVLIVNDAVHQYPYGADALKRDNPQTSFPAKMTDEQLAEFGVFPVKQTEIPEYDSMTQNVSESTPEYRRALNPDGTATAVEQWEWVQTWHVTSASSDEVSVRQAQKVANQKAQRLNAYQQEADPLFFKVQRGEATQEEWLAKVQEIKDRYPY